MRLKINRKALIEAIEKRIVELKAEYKKERDAYADKRALWEASLGMRLGDVSKRVLNGDVRGVTIHAYNNRIEVQLPSGNLDPEPKKPSPTWEPLEHEIAVLRLGSTADISMKPDDPYLKHLTSKGVVCRI